MLPLACRAPATAGVLLNCVCEPLKPDHRHGHPAANPVKQSTNFSHRGTGSKGLSILYLYAVYIYNMLDHLKAGEKCKEKVLFLCFSKKTRSLSEGNFLLQVTEGFQRVFQIFFSKLIVMPASLTLTLSCFEILGQSALTVLCFWTFRKRHLETQKIKICSCL